jgi:hypothetical protein
MPSRRPIVVRKGAPAWDAKLRDLLAPHIHRVLIADRLDRLLGRNYPDRSLSMPSRGLYAEAAPNLTNEVADLARDIASHWDELDPSLRERVREVFLVEEGSPVRVSLW